MKIVKGDLESYKSNLALLDKEEADCDVLLKHVDSFISDIGVKLKGEVYTAFGEKLQQYKTAIQSRKATATELKSRISSALETMSAYMGEYSTLDTEELDKLKNERASLKASYDSVQASINNSKSDSANLSSLRSQLNSLSASIDKLDKLIKVLEGLAGADASAYASVESITLPSVTL